MTNFATFNYVRKYIEKLKNYVQIDNNILTNRLNETDAQVDENTTNVNRLTKKELFTDLYTTDFCQKYFASKGATMSRSTLKYTVGTNFTSSSTAAGVSSVTITVNSGTTINSKVDPYGGVLADTIIYNNPNTKFLDQSYVLFKKMLTGYNTLIVRYNIETSLATPIKCLAKINVIRLDKDWHWLENFAPPDATGALIDNNVNLIFDMTSAIEYIKTYQAIDNTFNFNVTISLYPMVGYENLNTSSFTIDIKGIKFDVFNGTEIVPFELENYYTKSETIEQIQDKINIMKPKDLTRGIPTYYWSADTWTSPSGVVGPSPNPGYGDTTAHPIILSELNLYDKQISCSASGNQGIIMNEWKADNTFIKQTAITRNKIYTLNNNTDHITFTTTWYQGLQLQYTIHINEPNLDILLAKQLKEFIEDYCNTTTYTNWIEGKALAYASDDHNPSNIVVKNATYVYGYIDKIDISNASKIILSTFGCSASYAVNYVYYNENEEPIYVGTPYFDGVPVNSSNPYIKDYNIPLYPDAKYISVNIRKDDAVTWGGYLKVTNKV